jgi:hypothetical protein
VKAIKAAAIYFAVVFAAGFLLAPIRLLWLVPRIGTRTAELIEAPIMILVSLVAARWIVTRFHVRGVPSAIEIGATALIFLLAAEVGVGVAFRHLSLAEIITDRDPVSGIVYAVSLILFAIMPAVVR